MPCLEYKHLDHHHLVDVGPAALLALVVEHALDDGTEGLPVDQRLDFSELVPQLRGALALLSQCEIRQGFHGELIRIMTI